MFFPYAIVTGVDIGLPADDFVCSPEIKCNSDEKCDMVYQITQDKVTIHSDQQSFVSLLAKPQEKCVCLGPTCVNPCSANPCPRHKVGLTLIITPYMIQGQLSVSGQSSIKKA